MRKFIEITCEKMNLTKTNDPSTDVIDVKKYNVCINADEVLSIDDEFKKTCIRTKSGNEYYAKESYNEVVQMLESN